jgi:hypothetical protein
MQYTIHAARELAALERPYVAIFMDILCQHMYIGVLTYAFCCYVAVIVSSYGNNHKVEPSRNVMAHGDARVGEVKGKLANGVGSQYPSLHRNLVYPALLPLMRAHLGCQ